MRSFSQWQHEDHRSTRSPHCPSVVALVVILLSVLVVAAPAQQPSVVQSTPATPFFPAPAEVIPPVPTHWFSDDAKATNPNFAIALDRRLERFEHETTNQFLVVILPKMQSTATLDDYCKRVFNAWGVGQKGINNGVILFVFLADHKLRIEVGRGLETPLTNPVCQEIVNTIAARFRIGDFEGGITAGVDATIKTLQVPPPAAH